MTKRMKGEFFARKWLVILIVGVVLTIFGRVIDNKSLTQSGIVIGIGIDHVDEKYEVTIQAVAVSGSAGSDKSSTNYLTYSAKGETISEAVNTLSEKLGLMVSLSHCNLVIMSRSALRLNPIETFSALTKPLALPEQALIVATDEDIEKVFSSKIPSTENVSFFLQTVLLQDLGAGGLTSVTVKDFLAKRCSRSGGVALPYLGLEEMTNKPIGDSQSGDDKNFIIDINKNMVVGENGVEVVDETTAKAVNMFLNTKVKDKLSVRTEDGVVEFRIIKNSKSLEVDGLNIKANMKMNVSFVEGQGFNSSTPFDCNSPEVLHACKLLEKQLEKALIDSFLLSKTIGIDFLGLENIIYQRVGRTLEKDCLSKIRFDVNYSIKVTENS